MVPALLGKRIVKTMNFLQLNLFIVQRPFYKPPARSADINGNVVIHPNQSP
ncbi:hypothetical protein D3C77_457190 [compost metagenome]